MAYEYATYEKKGRIAVVTVNRPERMNALHPPANFELDAIWNDFERDPEVWVGILTGTGDKAFSAGNDLRFTAEHGRDMIRMADSGFGGLTNRTQCWKPIIAAVNGYALGAGAEMAINADFVLMAESARIGFPEASIGTFIGGGLTRVLPHLVGLSKARELVFLGELIDGREAKAIGLALAAFPDATFRADVYAFAERLAVQAPLSIALAKEQFNHGSERSYETALVAELEGALACMATRDWQEGIDAFAAKRKPAFRGE
jgi:enoyl-CoA hydratase